MCHRRKQQTQKHRSHGDLEPPEKRHTGLESGGRTTLNTAVHRICSYVVQDPNTYPLYNFEEKYSAFPPAEVRIFRYLRHMFLDEGVEDPELEAHLTEEEDESDNEAIFRHFYRRVWKWDDDDNQALRTQLAQPLTREEFAQALIRIGIALPHDTYT
jgi:hypothetical protein